MSLRSQALAQLEAGEEKPYLDEEADRDAAAGYYGDLDPEQDGALAQLLERTHRDRPPYNPRRSSTRGSTSSPTARFAASTRRRSSTRRS
jgi:hypothetical protein